MHSVCTGRVSSDIKSCSCSAWGRKNLQCYGGLLSDCIISSVCLDTTLLVSPLFCFSIIIPTSCPLTFHVQIFIPCHLSLQITWGLSYMDARRKSLPAQAHYAVFDHVKTMQNRPFYLLKVSCSSEWNYPSVTVLVWSLYHVANWEENRPLR